MFKFRIPGFYLIMLGFLGVLIFQAVSFISGLSYVMNRNKWEEAFIKLSTGYYRNNAEHNELEPGMKRKDVLKRLTLNLNVSKQCQNSVLEKCWPDKAYYADKSIASSSEDYPGFIMDNEVLVSGIQDTTIACSSRQICNTVSIDINGLQGPNTFGKDQFRMYYYKDKVVPYYSKDDKLIGIIVKYFLGLK